MKLIKSISGIRGIYNKSLTLDNASQFCKIFSQEQPDGQILLARDSRPHGKKLYKEILKTLNHIGRNVISCDIIPTPTAQFIVKKKKLAGGIIITASHNPIEWNGLKFLDNDGCFLNAKKMDKIFTKKTEIKSIKKGSTKKHKNAYSEHILNILNLKCINLKKIRIKQFKVVVDAVNGAAYKTLPILLEKLNCHVVKIHCENNGFFPRGTEPIPENITDLSEAVKKHNAHIGFATDPDADRLAIVSNEGKPIGEELTLVLAIESYLKYYKDKQNIVTNLSTSMGVDKIASKYNSKVYRTSVGEINVVEKMKKINSEIGGEGNGGVILKESHLGRDSLVAAALVLNYLAHSNMSLGKVLLNIPTFVMIKDKITIQNNIDFNKIKNQFMKETSINFNESDGLKLIWENKWVHIRKSNTEPIIRIISEAKNIIIAKKLINSIKQIIKS